MKRLSVACLNALGGIAGAVLTVIGLGTFDEDHGRIVGIGLILAGLSMLPGRVNFLEGVPDWTRGFARAFGLGWILIGVIAFVLSLVWV